MTAPTLSDFARAWERDYHRAMSRAEGVCPGCGERDGRPHESDCTEVDHEQDVEQEEAQ